MAPSSSGLGRMVLNHVTRVRFPSGPQINLTRQYGLFLKTVTPLKVFGGIRED